MSAEARLTEEKCRRLEMENARLRRLLQDRHDSSNIVGTSGPARQLRPQIARLAAADTPVLIRGESGTGKTLVAHAIHDRSARANRPLVHVTCAALPETLIDAELFGCEKGAFAGADALKEGLFEHADGGTLLLEDVGDIGHSTQIKLLHLLQHQEFHRVGGTEILKADVRVLAVTKRNLEGATAAGTFRRDLFECLNAFALCVPPLRDRTADLLLLTDRFLEQLSRNHRKNITRVSQPAIDALMSHSWPGNVRELRNVLERAVLACDGQVIHPHHLPPTHRPAAPNSRFPTVSLTEAVNTFERDVLENALKAAGGNRAKAARLLDTTERIVNYKLKKLGIDHTQFKV
jgi:Nif-specific regulatory protein